MSSNAAAGMSVATTLIGCLFALVGLVLTIVIFWRIFSKAGYSGALSLLMLIPIANIIMLCVLAFGRWPIYDELESLRQRAGGMGYPPQQPGYPQQPPTGYPPQPGYPGY